MVVDACSMEPSASDANAGIRTGDSDGIYNFFGRDLAFSKRLLTRLYGEINARAAENAVDLADGWGDASDQKGSLTGLMMGHVSIRTLRLLWSMFKILKRWLVRLGGSTTAGLLKKQSSQVFSIVKLS